MREDEIEWFESSRIPESLNVRHDKQTFSVDVLTYSATRKTHNIAFYDFDVGKWQFLLREPEIYFRWRYFTNKHDKYSTKKTVIMEHNNNKIIEDSVIIGAKIIRETKDSWYLDCEGDPVWFSKKICNFDEKKQELELPKWLLKKEFPNEKH